jgi:hypothetical protein
LTPIPSGTFVWSREFLNQNADLIFGTSRIDMPLGRHSLYGYPFRNSVIVTLNKSFDSICFSEGNAMLLDDPYENLVRMCRHKLHWVVPLLNDLSTRVFDILISGGIPIVPESLRAHPGIKCVHPDDILFYNVSDILNPHPLVISGIQLFDRNGCAGIARRFLTGWESHADCRLANALAIARAQFLADV